MAEHWLKTVGIYWDAVERGEKLFEVRLNDRFYQAGDTVRLLRLDDEGRVAYGAWREGDELDPGAIHWDTKEHIAKSARRILTRRLGPVLQGGQFGIEPRHCVFSLLPIGSATATSPQDKA